MVDSEEFIDLFDDEKRNYLEQFLEKITQFFGLSKLEFLACGSYGCAYDIGGGKILKLTSDKEEALTANFLRKKPVSKHIVNYYDVRRVKTTFLYSLILDRVRTLDADEKYFYNSYFYQYFFNRKTNTSEVREKFSHDRYPEDQIDFYLKLLSQRDSILKEMSKNKIYPIDAHKNNVGFNSKGNFVIFDLGVGSGPGKKITLKDIVV